jgi:hypothetical protein
MFNYYLFVDPFSNMPNNRVVFKNNFSDKVNEKIYDVYKRLGGITSDNVTWEFPQHISTKIFKTIIDNTCFKCGGIVNKGNALQNTMVAFADFGDDAGTRGSTQARIGIAEPIEVSKCTSCGHSVKYLNPNNHE